MFPGSGVASTARVVAAPRVSVLMPVRDAAATLPEALASLRRQTLADHELLAIDDGSSDGSAELLDAAAREDPRQRVRHTPPRGLVAALNHGLGLARGGVVARMDADDVAHPDRLLLQAARLEADSAVDVLGSRVELVAPPGLSNQGMRGYVAWQNGLLDHAAIVADLFVESPLVHPSVAMRRRSLLALGGYHDTGGPEDYDLWLRAHARGLRFGKCAETLLAWRDSPHRLTRCDPRYAAARFLECKCAALLEGPLADRAPVVVWGAGRIGKAWARRLRVAGRPAAAHVEVDAAKIGNRVHGVPVVGIEAAARFRGAWQLAAVGQPGARSRIRRAAEELGLPGWRVIAVA